MFQLANRGTRTKFSNAVTLTVLMSLQALSSAEATAGVFIIIELTRTDELVNDATRQLAITVGQKSMVMK